MCRRIDDRSRGYDAMGETRYQKPKAKGRTYVKATFTGYKRALRNQREHTALMQLEHVFNKEDAQFYVGKKCVYMWKSTKCVYLRYNVYS